MSRALKFLILLISIFKLADSRGGQGMVNGVKSDHQPFVVSLRNRRLDSPFGAGHICGGTIIASNAILTAASCIKTVIAEEEVSTPIEDINVIANSNMRYVLVNSLQADVLDIHIHPNYDPADRSNNVAILVVTPLPLNTRNIEAINITRDFPLPGTRCEIYGFGQALSFTAPPQKLVGFVQIFENFACRREPRENMICAGEDTYPCNGDEGGPLVCDNRVAGVIDFFDVGHCRGPTENKYISYIDVSSYRRWIEDVLRRIQSTSDPLEAAATTDGADLIAIIIFSLIFNIFITIVLI